MRNSTTATITPPAPVQSTPTLAEIDSSISKSNKPSRKTVCPISRGQFRKAAKAVKVNVAGNDQLIPTKEFSTGSLGWFLNGKTVIEVDGVACEVQMGLTLTIIGSKELPGDNDSV